MSSRWTADRGKCRGEAHIQGLRKTVNPTLTGASTKWPSAATNLAQLAQRADVCTADSVGATRRLILCSRPRCVKPGEQQSPQRGIARPTRQQPHDAFNDRFLPSDTMKPKVRLTIHSPVWFGRGANWSDLLSPQNPGSAAQRTRSCH